VRHTEASGSERSDSRSDSQLAQPLLLLAFLALRIDAMAARAVSRFAPALSNLRAAASPALAARRSAFRRAYASEAQQHSVCSHVPRPAAL
jgi:hypothetical protein